MLNLGMSELLIFSIIAVIILGPDKLPTAIRSVMKWYRQIKMLVSNVQRDIERELEITEIREKMEQEVARFKKIELQMQAQLDQIQKEVEQIEKSDPEKSNIKQMTDTHESESKQSECCTDALNMNKSASLLAVSSNQIQIMPSQAKASADGKDLVQGTQSEQSNIDQPKKVATA